MIELILMALLVCGDRLPFIANTEIYFTVPNYQIGVTDGYHVYIPDRSEKKILHFDGTGGRQPDIGGKGGGPGMFQWVTGVSVSDDFLYVFSYQSRKVHRFTLKGKFLDRMSIPHNLTFVPAPRKVKGGWVFLTKEKPEALIHANEDFTELWVIAGHVDVNSLNERKRVDYNNNKIYNPARGRISFGLASDGLIYFSEPGSDFRISAYDPGTRKSVVAITKKHSPIRVDPEWAEDLFKRFQSANTSSYFQWELEVPSHFPAILGLAVNWKDQFLIATARQRLEHGAPSDLYDPSGRFLGSARVPSQENKIIGRRGPWLFLTGYEDEELQIWRIPIGELDSFFDK